MLNGYYKLSVVGIVFALLLFPHAFTYSLSKINLFDDWDRLTNDTTNVIEEVYSDNSKPDGGDAYVSFTTFSGGNIGADTNANSGRPTGCSSGCTKFYKNGDGTYNTITYKPVKSSEWSTLGVSYNTPHCPSGTKLIPSSSTCCPNSLVEATTTGTGKGTSTTYTCNIPPTCQELGNCPEPSLNNEREWNYPIIPAECTTSTCQSVLPNACGIYGSGTQSVCTNPIYNKSCNAVAPPDPSGACSVSYDCASATGNLSCGGECNITRYPLCPSGDSGGDITWVDVPQVGAGEVSTNILAVPKLVRPGGTTRVLWLSTGTSECKITSTDGDNWTGTSNGDQEETITKETKYTLTCEKAGGGQTDPTSVTVRIVPEWQEI